MKKSILVFVFLILTAVVNSQTAKVIKGVNEAGDVASFELDCSVRFPSLAKGLRYNITRHEFKGPEMKNSYRIMLVMDGFYSKTLNNSMSISAVLSDGNVIQAKKIIEEDGFFDGACTLKIKDPNALLKDDIVKVIVHADKDVVYNLSEKSQADFKKNLKAVITAK